MTTPATIQHYGSKEDDSMQLTIHIEPFRTGFIALAVDPSKGDTEDGVPGGLRSTEQSAAQAALNAYFKAQRPETELPLDPPAARPVPMPSFSRRRFTEATLIETYLRQRITSDFQRDTRTELTLEYFDADGTFSSRKIVPTKIEDRRSGLGFKTPYLIALDVDKDEPRTFRLDRIRSVEGDDA